MRTAKFVVVAFADNAIVMDNYATHKRISPGKSQSLARQFKTAPHVIIIPIRHPASAFYYF
jgi:hypothetical protein